MGSPQPADGFGTFADPAPLVADLLGCLVPTEPVSVADYTAEHRYLSNLGGGYVGRWSHDVVPYLVEPMDRFTTTRHDCIVVVGPGQSAKTTIAENALLHAVPNRPAKWLWYMQSDAAVEAFVKDRIDPMIESHEPLRSNLGLRPIDDSLHFKRFKRMRAEWLAANRSNLISKSAPIIVADEIDAYPESLGDVKQLLDVRRQTYGMESMLLVTSHPDRSLSLEPKGWTAGVMLLYWDSTQGRWYWPCPHCGGYSSPSPGAEREMTVGWDDSLADLEDVAATAHMICPICGSVEITDQDRHAMNLGGKWVHLGETIAEDGSIAGEMVPSLTLGYWITGPMSPFVRGGLGGLVRARVKASRDEEVTGETTSLKEVMVKQWGWPWALKAATHDQPVDVDALLERAEGYPLGVVPDGVRFLLTWADVQANSFEVCIFGFGVDLECWVVDRFQIYKPADDDRQLEPAVKHKDWHLLVDQVLGKTYPLAGQPDRHMAILRLGVDSSGKAGVTANAYKFWRWCRGKRLARKVMLTKGTSHAAAQRQRLVYPDSQRKDRKAGARGEVPVLLFNANLLKDEIDAVLRNTEPGPGYLHLPLALKGERPPHLFFEQMTAEERDKKGQWHKTKQHNEALDQAVGARVLALQLKADRIKWEAPPAWAAPWDDNPLVTYVADDGAADKPVVKKQPTRRRRRRVMSKGVR